MVYDIVVVPSSSHLTTPQRAKSPGDTKAPIKTPIDDHHVEVSAIVTVVRIYGLKREGGELFKRDF